MSDLWKFGVWDVVLVVVVVAQATAVAYLYQPRLKALAITLPIPFTFATLAVGKGVDVTSAGGLLLLLVFTHGVRILHYRLKVPIVAAIAASALFYCVLGAILAPLLPRTTTAFWMTLAVISILAFFLWRVTSHRVEPGHRSPMQIWLKIPIITAVILGLIVIKVQLRGFVTVFPMVGVIAAYEARGCLWTICRQIAVVLLLLAAMMAVIHPLQHRLGLGAALAIGWVVYLALLIPATLAMWAKEDKHSACLKELQDNERKAKATLSAG